MTESLDDLVKALRETTSGEESAFGRYTRARVLSAVHLQRRTRIRNWALGLPFAAILMGSAAFAATGVPVKAMVERVAVVLRLHEPPSQSKPRDTKAKLGGKAAAQPNPISSVAVASSEHSIEPRALQIDLGAPSAHASEVVESTPSRRPTSPVGSARPRGAVERDSEVTEAELTLYERAHRAHFADKNPGMALQAWEAYLEARPQGRFALEAKYNRALCLLRLARTEEAVHALRPFAQGVWGGYREAEARALIAEIETSSTQTQQ